MGSVLIEHIQVERSREGGGGRTSGLEEEEEGASVSAGPLGKRTPLKSSVGVTNTQRAQRARTSPRLSSGKQLSPARPRRLLKPQITFYREAEARGGDNVKPLVHAVTCTPPPHRLCC